MFGPEVQTEVRRIAWGVPLPDQERFLEAVWGELCAAARNGAEVGPGYAWRVASHMAMTMRFDRT
jgi:hypothetical protein